MNRLFDWIYGFGSVGSIILIVFLMVSFVITIFILYIVIVFLYVASPVILFILAVIFVVMWIYKKIRRN